MPAEQDGDTAMMALAADFPAADRDAWLALVDRALKGRPFEKALTRPTPEGMVLQPLYTRADEPPAIPSTHRQGSTGRRENGWDIRQAHAHPDPATTNAEILRDLERGATSISLTIDPVGAAGIRVRGIDDLDRALAGVDLALAPVALRAGPAQAVAASVFLDLVAGRPGDFSGVAHDLGLDPLGALARHGTLPEDVPAMLRSMAAMARRTQNALPGSRAVVVDTTPYHDAGGNDITDLSAMLATAVAYLRALEAEGLDIEAAFATIGIEIAVGVDAFNAIAKLRAARLLWARLADACGASDTAKQPYLSVAMASRVVARRDVWVNMLRATAACFAAAVGGADAITMLPYTHALGLPDGFARRIARNTQIVLMEESNLHRVADPAGGSFAIERLSRELAERAWTAFQEIEADGGMADILLSGRIGDRVATEWAERERLIGKRRVSVTGVSEFPNLAENAPDVVAPPAPLPLGHDAFSAAWSTVGVEITPLGAHRLGEAFEDLRDASDRCLSSTGARPRAMLAQLGRLADYTARATFTKNYLEAGGIEPLPLEVTTTTAAAALGESGADVVVLCGSDTLYEEQAAEVASALRGAGAGLVLLAGRPGDHEAAWRAAGVGGFIHAGDDTLVMLRRIATHLGVIERKGETA